MNHVYVLRIYGRQRKEDGKWEIYGSGTGPGSPGTGPNGNVGGHDDFDKGMRCQCIERWNIGWDIMIGFKRTRD